jgi:chromosome segregation ATPase
VKTEIQNLLDDLSARLDCDVLNIDEKDCEVEETFAGITQRASQIADEVRQAASHTDALSFATELAKFLDAARDKAATANRLRAEIEDRQTQIAEAQADFQYLATGRSALAAKVRQATIELEQARNEYDENELTLGVLERRIETNRREISAIHRQLSAIVKSEEV